MKLNLSLGTVQSFLLKHLRHKMCSIIKNSFGSNFKLLRILAIYPPKVEFCSRRVFKFYAYAHQLLFTVGFPFLGIFQLIIQSDMDMYQIVDSLFVLSQLSLFPFKHLPFLVYNERLDDLVRLND